MLATRSTLRAMLKTYGKQLVCARRLARYSRQLGLFGGEERPGDARLARRAELVERIAREIVDNLLVTGTENPVVDEIKDRLQARLGSELMFEYPFMEQDLLIYRVEDGEPVRLSPDETLEVLTQLWEITLDTVDRTMV